MNDPSTNNDPSRLEQIVAYLDGELSPADEALIERQLAEDDAFRREVQSIDRAWLALDALPGVTVDDKFSQTTMEMVVGAAQQEVASQTVALSIRRRRQWLANVLLALAAAALGWLVVQLVRENPNRTLITDLPAIEYIDIYSQFQDVTFLRELRNKMGETPWATDLPVADLADRVQEFDTISSVTDRPQWLADLDDEDRVVLRSRYNHFLAVSAKEQSRLRNLHDTILTADDRDQLVETLLAYQAWLNTIPASQQFELREMPLDNQVNEIVKIQRREAENNWIELSAEEVQQLRQALLEMRKKLMDRMTPDEQDRLRNAGPGVRWLAMTRQFPELRQQWHNAAAEILSPEKRSQFDALSLDEQGRQLARWMREIAMRESRKLGPGKHRRFAAVSQEELERYFAEELDAATRERLLAQPRDRMEQQLKSLYLRGEFPNASEFPLGRDRFGPPGRDRIGPGPPHRGERGGHGPPRGERSEPSEDRPGFGRPPRRGDNPRTRDTPPTEDRF